MPSIAQEPILTVGVPLYNMERYLTECLDSMISVSNVPEGLEIIVVNDGSTDSSIEIARKYEKRFPGVVRVVDKPNGGHGSCINTASKLARGRYFKLLDSDDWLDSKALKSHLEKLSGSNADVVVTDYMERYEDGKERLVSFSDFFKSGYLNSAEKVYEAFSRTTGARSYLQMHSLTYRTELLHGIKITEHSFYVDLEYISFPLRCCRSFEFQPICLYQYRLGRTGQSVDPAIQKKRIGQVYNVISNLFAFYDSLDREQIALRHYLEGLLEDQCWGYLARTDNADGFAYVQSWWRTHEQGLLHPFARILRRDFTEDFSRRNNRMRLMHCARFFWELFKH